MATSDLYSQSGGLKNEEFDDTTTCCICTEVYTDPKALPCLHTFCKKCIQDTGLNAKKGPGDDMACPICQRMFKIPTEGFDGLPKNSFIERLIQMANFPSLSRSSREAAVCDACVEEDKGEGREKRAADTFCVDCKQKYCAECSRQHGKFKLTKNHKMTPINEHDDGQNLTCYEAACELHEQKVLDVYCVDCKTVVCDICFIESHINHKGSHVDKFVDSFRKQIESSVQRVNEYRSIAETKQGEFLEVKEDIQKMVVKLECDIANRKEELKQLTDKHEASLLQGLSSIRQSKLKEIQMATDDIDTYLTCSETYNSYCQKIIAKGAASDICRAFANLSERATELHEQCQPMIERKNQSIDLSLRKSALEEFLDKSCDNFIGAIEEKANSKGKKSAQHQFSEQDKPEMACFLLKDCEIICSDLNLESRVDSFLHTEIWKGKWKKSMDVSVKKFIDSERSAAEVLNEAHHLHRLKHPNIVELIGISFLERPLLIVTEYLSHGNLRDYLRKDQGNTVDLPLIIDFARQIIEGMCFVSMQGIVHRDLRAVNLLLASPKLVKISNFELALDLQDPTKQSKGSMLPIRWTAPESLELGRWTPASDVWSFGILLYEMFTFGEIPYSDRKNREVIKAIKTDYRLPHPVSENKLICPDTVYQTMVECWDKDPNARLSFHTLKCYFAEEIFQVSKADIALATILSRPKLVTAIKGRTAVRGVALLDGWLYVARLGSNQVEVYEAKDNFKRCQDNITITPSGQQETVGILNTLKSLPKKDDVLSGIQDIASCNRNRRLYLSDWENMCVHCVDSVRKEVIQSWGVESGGTWGLSVTSEGNVVVSCGASTQLCEYSAEGLLLRKIRLEMTDAEPLYGLQLFDDDSWVVCYGDRNDVDGHVSVVELEGNCVIGHEEIQLKGPSHLAVLSSHYVLVAESRRNRIILLRPSLHGPVREILNPRDGIVNPVRIHLCESSGRLVVGLMDGIVLVYQIMKVSDEPTATVSN